MLTWWNGLDTAAQIFFCFAIFFGLMFLWQFIAAILGLGGHGGDLSGGHGDFGGGHGAIRQPRPVHGACGPLQRASRPAGGGHLHGVLPDLHVPLDPRLLHALHLVRRPDADEQGRPDLGRGIRPAVGLGACSLVALVFFLMQKLAETGTERIETCLGTTGMVYADIPSGGLGQIRCTVSGCLTVVKARGAGGQAIKAGDAVHILWKIDDTTVEVQPSTETAK